MDRVIHFKRRLTSTTSVFDCEKEGGLWNPDDPRHLHPSIRNVISYPRGTCPLATSPSSSGYMLSFFVATTNGD
ncbi:uncharacterized protein STEHIDRAFT_155023 [Stereum hirsutum FP-91666 SS1]|uniref:uncharacterized protein n=1 Tax=Stereum hirsutum (strain FP-91666) TaxID=721885 RepID=UPI000440C111|nr:uncharacterized protein STEHIDRAFT_155023 [Stereum hirsutum FP-91666 SS1]EIM89348.1 hypothetical protein STEHIDRAFT_155023 [Stereum hirsutum FP-91666 SS1]